MWSLRSLDSFPKFRSDVSIKTHSGAILSFVSFSLIFILVTSEIVLYLSPTVSPSLSIDASRMEKLRINFDLTYPMITCSLLTLDVMDMSGGHQEEVEHTVHKKRLDKEGNDIGVALKDEIGKTKVDAPEDVSEEGKKLKAKLSDPKYCGSCYGAELGPGDCCNTCQKVKESYNRRGWAFATFKAIEQCHDELAFNHAHITTGEGCHIFGYLEVNKVAGNIHFAPGKSIEQGQMHMHDAMGLDPNQFNMTHTINHLSFGEFFPGMRNPLDQVKRVIPETGSIYQYYLKIVPSKYHYHDGRVVQSNQYSVTEHNARVGGVDGNGLPAVFFYFDLSPIMVTMEEKSKPLFHFITQLCAIVGGVFTVSGIVDRILHSAVKSYNSKEL